MLVRSLVFVGLLATLTCAPIRASSPADFDTVPIPVKTPSPIHPMDLRQKGVTGMVSVRARVDEKGNVAACSIIKSSRYEFEEPALDAVKLWKFKPATRDGAPVSCSLVIPITFSIR